MYTYMLVYVYVYIYIYGGVLFEGTFFCLLLTGH